MPGSTTSSKYIVDIVSNPSARFLFFCFWFVLLCFLFFCCSRVSTPVIDANLGACGLTGSDVIGTQLTGDAFYGTWSGFEPGTVDNTQSASTTFYWTPAQVGTDVVLVFEPTSVCIQTAQSQCGY